MIVLGRMERVCFRVSYILILPYTIGMCTTQAYSFCRHWMCLLTTTLHTHITPTSTHPGLLVGEQQAGLIRACEQPSRSVCVLCVSNNRYVWIRRQYWAICAMIVYNNTLFIHIHATFVCDRIFCNQCNPTVSSSIHYWAGCVIQCTRVWHRQRSVIFYYYLLGVIYTDIFKYYLVCVCVNYLAICGHYTYIGYHLKCNAMLSRCIVQGYTTIEYSWYSRNLATFTYRANHSPYIGHI